MPKIQKTDFVRSFEGKSLDVKEAKNNAALAGLDVARADVNKDGKISGQDEAGRLFAEVDRFDHDGASATIDARLPTGAPTQGAKLIDVITGQLKVDAGGNGAGPESVVRAANKLVTERGQNYGVDDAWFNLDPNHALPANVSLGGLRGKWKCNLFACNTVYAAGFEPPYYLNRGKGEYPNANQLYKWSDKYAAQNGNKTHFKLVDELDIQNAPDRDAAMTKLLASAKPGDLIIVDHPGSDVADGGHCRVLVGGSIGDGSGELECAQASYDAAVVKKETLDRFTGDEHIWILRPNKPRAGKPIA